MISGTKAFQLLQQWQKRPTAAIVLYPFDLLWSDGRDISGKTVLQRRERLEQIINPFPRNPIWRLRRESWNRPLLPRQRERT
jgi:ATP-dependent DNA ligase